MPFRAPLAALLLLVPATLSAGEPSPPAALGVRFADALTASMRRLGAHSASVQVRAGGDLGGAPALYAIGPAIDDALGKLATTGDAEVEIVAELTRVRGRVALGGALLAKGETKDWVLVSDPETPDWWPWLTATGSGVDPSGFSWRRVGVLPGIVRDATSGDLDGDGRPEWVAATDEGLFVFATGAAPSLVASIALGDGPAVPPAETASRDPRTFVRVPGPRFPGEILVRRSDERRTRVYALESGKLVRRSDRDALVLAARGPDLFTAELAPGTNRFVDPPRTEKGPAKLPAGPWVDLRTADLATERARLTASGPVLSWLDGGGTLHLLRADLGEVSRTAHCGSAFDAADWDGDGRIEVLCAGDGPSDAPDTLTLHLAHPWSVTVPGTVEALSVAPGQDEAITFVDPAGEDGHSELWMLRRVR